MKRYWYVKGIGWMDDEMLRHYISWKQKRNVAILVALVAIIVAAFRG